MMRSDAIIHFIPDRCKRCYTCVPRCPAQAISIQRGQARVIKERCIGCGKCITVCAQGANEVKSHIDLVWQLLGRQVPVIAILSSSFPAAFPDISPRRLVTALKKLGFSEVMEAAFGAELVAKAYKDLILHDKKRQLILTCCPVVVALLEKFYPGMINLAAPVVSPMVAMGRVIKRKYNPRAKVVFIGPCIAKKIENESEDAKDVIDAVLTFSEIKEMFDSRDIVLSEQEEGDFPGPKPNLGRMYALPGGLAEMTGIASSVMKDGVVVAEGEKRVLEVLKELSKGTINARFLELLFCEGCVSGPMIGNDLSFFHRKQLIIEYTMKNADTVGTTHDILQYADVDLSRSFTPKPVTLRVPTQADLRQILTEMNMVRVEDELNCGACGYQSCQELAIAIFQGLAEKEMCWPYIMETLATKEMQLTETECRRFYLEHIARALEEEDKRIARELHDSVAQTLIAVLHQVENFLDDKEHFQMKDARFLLNMAEEIRSVLQEVRQFSHDLRPSILDDLGLVPALNWLARQQQATEGVEVRSRFIGAERRFPADTELGLFRIAQEALRNVSRHSSASQAELTFEMSKDKAVLTIADSGVGFHVPEDIGEFPELGKLGLIGMQERARLLSGRMMISSQPGRGTTITVEVPLSDSNNATSDMSETKLRSKLLATKNSPIDSS